MKSRRITALVLLAVSLLLVTATLFMPKMKGDTVLVARRVETVLKHRIKTVEKFAGKAMESDPQQWLDLGKVPDDVVIYRYVSGRLQSWVNQFPVSSDDLIPTSSTFRLSNPRARVRTPLSELGNQWGFFHFGQQSYLAKRIDNGNVKLLVGLNVERGRHFKLDEGYRMVPLSSDDGTVVNVAGEPCFRIIYDAMPVKSPYPADFVWIAYLLACIGLLLLLSCRPDLPRALATVVLMTAGGVSSFLNHPVLQGEITLILTILLVNIMVFFVSYAFYLAREDIWRRIKSRRLAVLLRVLVIILILGAFVLAYFNILQVITYIHISLELYKLGMLSLETGLVYLTFGLMFIGLVLLFQLLRITNVFTIQGRIVASSVVAAFLVVVTSSLGFQKEETIISHWAERLANERDITMENHLRRCERQIDNDEVLANANASEETAREVIRHLTDKYFFRSLKDYTLHVQIGGDSEGLGFDTGVQIAPGSRFYYAPLSGQRCRYVGAFHYFIPDKGQKTLYISVEPKDVGNRDAFNVVISSRESENMIPALFSYAKYNGNERQYFKGVYAYPTKLTADYAQAFAKGELCHFSSNGYLHFVNTVGEGEYMVISRVNHGELRNILSFIFVAILLFFTLSIFPLRLRHRRNSERNYFKTAVTIILVVSLSITMATLVVASVTFVYNRNEANARRLMSDKANSIRAMLQTGLRSTESPEDLTSRETMVMLRRTSDNTMSNISLYRPDGRVFMSTTPEMFDRMIVGCRMNGVAYEEIMYRNRGFSILRERYGDKRIYTMYAPIMDQEGNVLCIFASPYLETGFDFQWDAVMHSVSIVVIFIILLMISTLSASLVIDRIFKPLSEMKDKMEVGGLDSLEHIVYQHDDEIKPLVDSYNRMVDDLMASSRTLAQAERDKAWSEMARNVAHEIKNPLTPMQLQIQRVQRLKSLGDPNWQLRFDEMAKVLLDHIEVLTDTANQFSDFAKLYSEEPVRIKLDSLLQEEVAMYDSRPGVKFEYLGLPDTEISGPRPQLVRVFVNLLNNAVQACEDREDARIAVSLRNGADPDFYEIVFEDNGPGVDESNVERLFTPHFTTKSSGSGLGLTICRSILERCGASISYSRSFLLGGACFTIQYPKD